MRSVLLALGLGGLLISARPASAQQKTEEGLPVEGPVVVFVYPAKPTMDAEATPAEQALHDLQTKFKPQLEARKIKVLAARPSLIRFGEEDNPRKRMRPVDFRRTPGFLGTVLFAESHEPQIHQGLESEADLLARIDAYFAAAKKK